MINENDWTLLATVSMDTFWVLLCVALSSKIRRLKQSMTTLLNNSKPL